MPCFWSISYVVLYTALMASIPTQRWKHAAVSLAQQALHLDLVDQVLGGLVDVGEPVDGLSGEMEVAVISAL